ncbi:S53 family peptidase [Telmatospirillum sp.]|uniref:S53 family peptidase n=1 Tax=Telmatospirillum sp. TaxID=2079197 RepID=UPI002842239A|nr:S53 family peptidase [Telmatospirillum sp.]MDR3436569.1 S53 family peptidase [Telmatospirillum sp.]
MTDVPKHHGVKPAAPGHAAAIRVALAAVVMAGLIGGQDAAADPVSTGATKPASGQGSIHKPASSLPESGDAGTRMRTHVSKFVPMQQMNPQSASVSGYFFETPASLACLYGLTTTTTGCIPGKVSTVASGGSKVIAIVDAYDHPWIASDLAKFSAQFGLPTANLQVVYATGRRPNIDQSGGWELEEALDVEVAHAMAPSAKIILVEAASSSLTDLLKAVDVASSLVATAGGGQVVMSWGSDEFSGEASYDTHFATKNVVYLAASGDSPGVSWPATSANVIAVGGTSVSRNPTTGVLISEAAWSDGGGGPSSYVGRPAYQSAVASLVGTTRATPDIAAVADPNTGVWVYNSFPYEGVVEGWMAIGGTSVAAPLTAAVINSSGTFRASSATQLATIYAAAGTSSFKSITRGICGPYAGYSPGTTWSPCVGLGSPNGRTGF